jgi:secreted PhoX family phosphatase
MKFVSYKLMGVVGVSAMLLSGCTNNDDATPASAVELKNQSVTPALVKKLPGFENVEVFSLVGSDDQLPQSPNFVFGGSADGAGLLRNADGTYNLLVNHEDNFAVSRITLDNTFKPVRGEYVLNSTGGLWRLCSATLATPEEHGFGPVYLTCGESGEESRTHALNPNDPVNLASTSREVAGLGRQNAENAVPLNRNAYPNRTVIIIGDDDSGTTGGGQVMAYVSDRVGDLNSGRLYMLRRVDRNQTETAMRVGQRYEVEFALIENGANLTGRQINESVNRLGGIAFGRVEDIDYRKGSAANNRELYFCVTGQNNTGVNVNNSRTKYGRVYRLRMNDTDPLRGTLEVILDGDDRNGPARQFQNPDNIYVGENYVYVQEDPNGYGDETHDAYIYQYNIATGAFRPAIECDHRRDAPDQAKYNVGGRSRFGSWEYGAMIDVSSELGQENTFVVCVQPHTWTGERYRNADGGSLRPNESQASQLIVIKGLPK